MAEKKKQKIKLKLTVEVDPDNGGVATILEAKNNDGTPLKYADKEQKRMGKDEWSGSGAILATKNWCCWGLEYGSWVCKPQYC